MMERSFPVLCAILFIGLVEGAQITGLANGNDVGSLVGNVWNPGRTNGVVNAASWAIVPTNTWTFVNGTMLADLEKEIVAAIPGWRDPGSDKWNGVTEAWNGVAIDEVGHRAWWVCAGGHGNSANNGIYRFDAFNMKYSIEHMPSDTNQWSYGYTNLVTGNSYSGCAESVEMYNAKVAAGTIEKINDWYYDELYWDREPTSRHVYSGVVYAPERDELIMAVRRVWRYSRPLGKWIYKVQPSEDYALGEENIAQYDQSRDQLLAISAGSSRPWSNHLNLSNNTWTGLWVYGAGSEWASACDYRHGNIVTIFKGIEPLVPSYNTMPGAYVMYDIVTREILIPGTPIQYGPGVLREHFTWFDGDGMVYIPTLNRYWVCQWMSGGPYAGKIGWFELDPTTTPWTYSYLNMNNQVFPTLTPGPNAGIVRRRMMFLPSMNAILWLGSGTKNVQVYKIGEYIPPTSAPTTKPTTKPTSAPTSAPTAAPTIKPTSAPTTKPTPAPTSAPTTKPTSAPTAAPTIKPTSAPTTAPTVKPTSVPTSAPTIAPTTKPTSAPTAAPTTKPTSIPTSAPTAAPTSAPTSTPKPTSPPTSSPTTSTTGVRATGGVTIGIGR